MSDLQAEVAADRELIERLRAYKPYRIGDGEWFGPTFCADAADRLEALSRPTPAGELAGELMERFYLSADYDPKAERPADTVKAAISFALRHTGPTYVPGDGD